MCIRDRILGTNTNFPWTTIEELLANEDETSTSFRIKGYIREVPTKLYKQDLAMVCAFCCNCVEYAPSRIKCSTCQNARVVVFHFSITLGENAPDFLPRASPELKVFVAGKHAEVLLDMTVEDYLESYRHRKKVVEKLKQLEGEFVTISINRARFPGKNYGYQLVNTYLTK